ncbi:unnamed protein product [Cunninghamella echinulata]
MLLLKSNDKTSIEQNVQYLRWKAILIGQVPKKHSSEMIVLGQCVNSVHKKNIA